LYSLGVFIVITLYNSNAFAHFRPLQFSSRTVSSCHSVIALSASASCQLQQQVGLASDVSCQCKCLHCVVNPSPTVNKRATSIKISSPRSSTTPFYDTIRSLNVASTPAWHRKMVLGLVVPKIFTSTTFDELTCFPLLIGRQDDSRS